MAGSGIIIQTCGFRATGDHSLSCSSSSRQLGLFKYIEIAIIPETQPVLVQVTYS